MGLVFVQDVEVKNRLLVLFAKVAKSAFLVMEQVDILVNIVVVAEIVQSAMMDGSVVNTVGEKGRSPVLIVMVRAITLMLVATIVVDGGLYQMAEIAQNVVEVVAL